MTGPRVTITEIRAVLPTGTALTDPQINIANETASMEVDELVDNCGMTFTDVRLAKIELYLSAHYCAMTENTLSLTSEKDPCSGGSATYGFKFGEGILGTSFGQTANRLSGGCLQESDKRPARLLSIGSI
jgi:hypothetical protein